mgnify:CR=1 FL=1
MNSNIKNPDPLRRVEREKRREFTDPCNSRMEREHPPQTQAPQMEVEWRRRGGAGVSPTDDAGGHGDRAQEKENMRRHPHCSKVQERHWRLFIFEQFGRGLYPNAAAAGPRGRGQEVQEEAQEQGQGVDQGLQSQDNRDPKQAQARSASPVPKTNNRSKTETSIIFNVKKGLHQSFLREPPQ